MYRNVVPLGNLEAILDCISDSCSPSAATPTSTGLDQNDDHNHQQHKDRDVAQNGLAVVDLEGQQASPNQRGNGHGVIGIE